MDVKENTLKLQRKAAVTKTATELQDALSFIAV